MSLKIISDMKLSRKLKEILDQKKVSLSELSRKTQVPKTTLHSWLTTDKTNVNLSQLQKVARYLEISVHELAFGESDPFEKLGNEVLRELFSGDLRVTVHKIEKRK
jgi:DNA-binding Xre family transcriptional regulator